jgi:hypothetical protein
MSFFRAISFRAAGADLLAFLRAPQENRFLIFLISCIPPAVILVMIQLDSFNKSVPPPPTVTYIESWPATRTIEESKAANAEYQKKKDAMLLREKEAYKAFGRAVGMDVDAIEREAEAERTAKAKAGAGK